MEEEEEEEGVMAEVEKAGVQEAEAMEKEEKWRKMREEEIFEV